MINLLAYDKKAEIHAGRANVIIRSYITMTIIALGLLLVIIAGTYYTLNLTRATAQSRVDSGVAATAKYSQTKQNAEEFRKNLATTKQILSKEVTYSGLILKIAHAVPSGVVLDNLALDESKLGTPTTLTAHAKDRSAALALKTSFENQTNLFSAVHFESLSFDGGSTGSSDSSAKSSKYPVSVSLNVTINPQAVKQ